MTVYMYIATFCWICLLLGYLSRTRRKVHIPLVLTGIIGDFCLVGYLQVTREAVQTALEFSLGPLQQIHIGLSTVALVFYVPTVIYGRKVAAGSADPTQRAKHRKFAITALLFRTGGFVFMFSMWQ